MSKQLSNIETIICRNCGTANRISKALAKRYFEGYRPQKPMYMSNRAARQSKQPAIPRCCGCKQLLLF